MALNKEKIEIIEDIAWDYILEAYGNNEIVPPIDVMKVAESIGLSVKFGHFEEEGMDGAFIRENRTVYVNSKASGTRQSFTIGHELGHYVLHDDKAQEKFYRRDALKFDDDKGTEQEANWFAASLLMPRGLVHRYCEIFNSVQGIADAFMVSYSAAYWRLKYLGYVNEYE